MNLKIDEEKCIGCGTCVALAPDIFKMNDDGKAELLDAASDEKENIQMAVDSCPTQAISHEE